METAQISKAITIGALFRVDIGNVNAGWTEGVVTTIKKVETPDGNWHPYVSGQAIRRYIRDTIADILHDDPALGEMSPEEKSSDSKAPVLTVGDPKKYVDDDIFGFMRAIKTAKKSKTDEMGDTRKRTSPLRVAPAYGLFKLTGDRDLGTRSAIAVTGSAQAGGSIFETEITNNIFRTSMLLELDRIGVWKNYETVDQKDIKAGGSLPDKERKNRIMLILQALKYLWGGGRQSRFLVDLSPQFIIYARMAKKIPIFLNCLSVNYDNGNYLDLTQIKEVLNDYKYDIHQLIVGIRSGFVKNDLAELQSTFGADKLHSIGDAISLMIKDAVSSRLPEVK